LSLERRIAEIQAGMERAALRLGDLPVNEAMLFRLLVTVGRELSALLDQALRPHGLNETDFRTLMMLFSQPNGVACPSDLCLCVSQSPANMTRIADSLLERGLITRAPSDEDRRRMLLRITPNGEALVRQLMPITVGRMRALFGDMPAAQLQQQLLQLKHLCCRLDALIGAEGTA